MARRRRLLTASSPTAMFGYDWYLELLGSRWALFHSNWKIRAYDENTPHEFDPSLACLLYDMGTGERVPASTLLLDGWREHSEILYSSDSLALDEVDPDECVLVGVTSANVGAVELSFGGYGDGSFTLSVDCDYIAWE